MMACCANLYGRPLARAAHVCYNGPRGASGSARVSRKRSEGDRSGAVEADFHVLCDSRDPGEFYAAANRCGFETSRKALLAGAILLPIGQYGLLNDRRMRFMLSHLDLLWRRIVFFFRRLRRERREEITRDGGIALCES